MLVLQTLLPRARRNASAAYAVVVCPSVCLAHVSIVPKLRHVGSRKQRFVIAQGL